MLPKKSSSSDKLSREEAIPAATYEPSGDLLANDSETESDTSCDYETEVLKAIGADAEPSARPDSKKKEKQQLRRRSTIEAVDYLMAKKKEADLEKGLKKEERCNKAFALQEERIKLDREKFEFERELEEDKIIALDLSTMTYDQQQYFEDRKNKVLARRLNI